MIKKQFTLYLENKPGELAKVIKKLANVRVNIEGISVSESTDISLVQIVVSNAMTTRQVLSKSKIAFTIQDVALLPIRNEPGALSEIVARLASFGVNINYVYATASDCKKDCDCYAIISAPNLKKVEAAWKST
jgi:hypothetical protein